MYGSNRSGYAAFAALAILLLTVWTYLIWQVSAKKQFYADTAKQEAEATQERTNRELEECVAKSPSVLECVEAVVASHRESERSEYDLAAQQEMAYWTPWILLSSVAAAAIAGIGVVYLANSNRVVQEGAFQSQRPWVSLTARLISGFTFDERGGQIKVRFIAKNHGLSPSLHTWVDARIVASASAAAECLPKVREAAEGHARSAAQGDISAVWFLGGKLFPNEEMQVDYGLLMEQSDIRAFWDRAGVDSVRFVTPTIVAVVSYCSPLHQKVMSTEIVASVLGRGPDDAGHGMPIMVDQGDIDIANLRILRLYGEGGAS